MDAAIAGYSKEAESMSETLKQYRKLPVVVWACRWWKNGDHPDDDCHLITTRDGIEPFQSEGKVVRYFRSPQRHLHGHLYCDKCKRLYHDHGWIDTLEGGHIVCPGDFIITGVQGERYPCKPDIFEQTYELVEGDD